MSFTIGRYLLMGVLLGVLSACASQTRLALPTLPPVTPDLPSRDVVTPDPPSRDVATPEPPSRDVKEGIASWYGQPHHGRLAASGEVFDMYSLTAAHRYLPFDTIVRVQNRQNGREVDVRINDRGPFVDGRIIDLSYAAAEELDMVLSGIAPVTLQVVQTARPFPGPVFSGLSAALDSPALVQQHDD